MREFNKMTYIGITMMIIGILIMVVLVSVEKKIPDVVAWGFNLGCGFAIASSLFIRKK